MFRSFFVFAVILHFLPGTVIGQGLIPTDRAVYDQIPEFDPSRASGIQFQQNADGDRPSMELIEVDAPEFPLPAVVDLKPFAPTPRNQSFNDCVAWAVAYCSLSTQLAVKHSRTNDERPCELFSPQFLYPNITDENDGAQIHAAPGSPSAVGFLMENGCSTFATCPPSRTWNTLADRRATAEAWHYMPKISHQECSNPTTIKQALVRGIPVVIAAWACHEFTNAALNNNTIYRWGGDRTGAHAMCIIGYDDNRAAFEVQNSWGTDWGNGGRCWVAYSEFPQHRGDQSRWCYEAHVIRMHGIRNIQARKTHDRSFFLMPDGSLWEQKQSQRGAQYEVLFASGSVLAAESTTSFLYCLMRDGRILGIAGNTPWDITSGSVPRGFNGGQGQMIAASPMHLYAVTRRGNVRGRITRQQSSNGRSYWQNVNLPDGEVPIDIRYDGITSVRIATEDGDVFERHPGSNGQPGYWVKWPYRGQVGPGTYVDPEYQP